MVKKSLLLFSIMVFTLTARAAEFTASISSDQIGLDETANLTLSLKGASAQETINLSKLKENFDIISISNYSSIEVINGASSSTQEWHFILKPKKIGKLIISPFTIKTKAGELATKEIAVKVTKGSNRPASKSNNIFAVAEVANPSPYLDQPIIYKIKLITEADLREVKFDELKIEGALIRHLGAHKVYDSTHNKKPVKIIELDYLITPTKSGKLLIPPQTIKGLIAVPSGRNDPRIKSLFSSFFVYSAFFV